MATRKQVQHYLGLLRELEATQRISVLVDPQRISVPQGQPKQCVKCSEATDERHYATCEWLADQYAFDQFARQS
jgi:hypothetical protein